MHWQTNDGENGMIKTWDGQHKTQLLHGDRYTYISKFKYKHACAREPQFLMTASSIISKTRTPFQLNHRNYYKWPTLHYWKLLFSHFAGIINQYTFLFIRERFQIFKKVKPIYFKFHKMKQNVSKKTSLSLKTTHNIACKRHAIR